MPRITEKELIGKGVTDLRLVFDRFFKVKTVNGMLYLISPFGNFLVTEHQITDFSINNGKTWESIEREEV